MAGYRYSPTENRAIRHILNSQSRELGIRDRKVTEEVLELGYKPSSLTRERARQIFANMAKIEL